MLRAMIGTIHTRDEQLETLRKMGGGQMLDRAESVAWLCVVLLVALGFYKSWVPCYMIAAFLAFVAASSRATLANLRNAVRGDREGVRTPGTVEIAIETGGDSPSYFATTTERGIRWNMEFIATGWKPVAGNFRAQLVHLGAVEWPVLVLLDDGIVVPRNKPSRI